MSATGRGPAPKGSKLKSMLALVAYVTVSMLMTLLNKHIISYVKFPGTNFLLLSECIICSLLLGIYRWGQFDPFNGKIFRFLSVCTIAKAFNMVLSFVAMKYTSLPVYNCLKRMNPIAAMILESFLREKHYSWQSKAGVSLIFIGACVTASGDLDFEILGYSCAMLAVFGQASYLVLSARAQDALPSLDHIDLLFYTGFYNVFLFLPLAIPELSAVQEFWDTREEKGYAPSPLFKLSGIVDITKSPPGYATSLLFGVFGLYAAQGIILNLVTFWCTQINSPVTTGVAGNVKGLLTSIYAIVFFSVNLTTNGWVGLVINAMGGMGYTWSRIGGAKKGAEKGAEEPKASEKGSSGGAKVNAAARKKKQ